MEALPQLNQSEAVTLEKLEAEAREACATETQPDWTFAPLKSSSIGRDRARQTGAAKDRRMNDANLRKRELALQTHARVQQPGG